MSLRSLLAVLLLGAVHLSAAPAWAKSRHTYLKEVIAQSETIVIAKLDKLPKYGSSRKTQLDVLQVLRGNLKPGKHEVTFEDYPRGGPGDFVAFLDKNLVWRFTAAPLAAKKVKDAVLVISGFNDRNAHWVTPALLTLEQLKTYLKERSLLYKFRGDIYFPQAGKMAWKPGTLRIRGTYNAMKDSARVKGLPALKGLPAQPKVLIHNMDEGAHIDLEYSANNDRPLHLLGAVVGFDPKSNEMIAQFAVSAPDVLRQKSLEDYLADARRGPCYYAFRLTCPPTTKEPKQRVLMLTLGEKAGAIGDVRGWGKGPLAISCSSYNGPSMRSGSSEREIPKKVAKDLFAEDWVLRMVAPTDTGEFLVLAFDLGKPKRDRSPFRWTFQNTLLYNLYRTPVRGTLLLHDGKKLHTVTKFRVDLHSVGFIPREMPPKKTM
jgi:hypothetical protein